MSFWESFLKIINCLAHNSAQVTPEMVSAMVTNLVPGRHAHTAPQCIQGHGEPQHLGQALLPQRLYYDSFSFNIYSKGMGCGFLLLKYEHQRSFQLFFLRNIQCTPEGHHSARSMRVGEKSYQHHPFLLIWRQDTLGNLAHLLTEERTYCTQTPGYIKRRSMHSF